MRKVVHTVEEWRGIIAWVEDLTEPSWNDIGVPPEPEVDPDDWGEYRDTAQVIETHLLGHPPQIVVGIMMGEGEATIVEDIERRMSR